MFDIINTIATVTSAIFQWLDFSRKSNADELENMDSKNRGHQESHEITQAKISAIISEIRDNQDSIRRYALALASICFVIAASLSSVETASPTPKWLIFAIPFFVLAVIAYGILTGATRFFIQRSIDYYSLDEDAFSQLKLKVAKVKWDNTFVQWIIRDTFLQISRDRSRTE